jgi:hypothetical protein
MGRSFVKEVVSSKNLLVIILGMFLVLMLQKVLVRFQPLTSRSFPLNKYLKRCFFRGDTFFELLVKDSCFTLTLFKTLFIEKYDKLLVIKINRQLYHFTIFYEKFEGDSSLVRFSGFSVFIRN